MMFEGGRGEYSGLSPYQVNILLPLVTVEYPVNSVGTSVAYCISTIVILETKIMLSVDNM